MVDPASVIYHFTYVGISCLLILGGLGLPVPEDAVLIASGLLMAHGIIGLAPALLVIYPSLLIADFILYSIGRKYGRRLVGHKRFSKIVSSAVLARFEKKFLRWGALMVFAGRHFVGFRAPIFVMAGIMGLPRTKFLIADALSVIITIFVMVGLGYGGGSILLILKKDITRIDYLLFLAIILLLAGWILRRYFMERLKGRKGLKRTD
jgi:membrane protein DedA with SNARE-associated domain